MRITELNAIQILDSRGNPTLKVLAWVDGISGEFSVPSGASTGSHEALELRDGGSAFDGQGVKKAIENIKGPISDLIVGQDPFDLRAIDNMMNRLDGTDNKAVLGANAILGVSGAVTVASANALKIPLFQYIRDIYENDGHWQSDLNIKVDDYIMPKMYFNILNGGKHAENNVDIQETMIVPQKKTIAENIKIASEIYHSLKKVLISKNMSVGLGDEGGFAPNLESNTKVFEVVLEAIEKAGYVSGKDVAIAIDVAATEIFSHDKDDKYILGSEGVGLNSQQLVSWYKELATTYPIISIEDGLSEDDWDGWKHMTERIGDKIQLVGDDLFVTNPVRIKKGIDEGAGTAVLIKINQIGTITETLDAIHLALKNKMKCMVSHRSGETTDSFIADLVVGTGVGQIKSGAPARGERTAKYNRLLEIEEYLINNK
ncbi:MAG: phosphopyruvate hydratase [bacterium]